jgi:uncharacterized flavoprotein (TIGR03862 family)
VTAPSAARPNLAIIGGGPAGLRAAETAAAAGVSVTVFDAKSSVGRKFLVAGRGGLNLTKTEPLERFLTNYAGPDLPRETWNRIVAEFPPEALRAWAAGLGVETFAASTGRVYPREMKAAPLLRRWVQRLKASGVQFAMRHRWRGFAGDDITSRKNFGLIFEVTPPAGTAPQNVIHQTDAVILAMGGGSWPETGSDGAWAEDLRRHGVAVSPLQPANCGWEVAWPESVRTRAEGLPLKNITATVGPQTAAGELLITRYGLEGGALYQLGAVLRTMPEPRLTIDLKPAVDAAALVRKLGLIRRNFVAEARTRWRLSDSAAALLETQSPASAEETAALAKAFPVDLEKPRPLAEAISSAGGVRWSELDDHLMIRALPGVYCAGEMIDWEAPTGGYLMQGCFASGTRAGQAAAARLLESAL